MVALVPFWFSGCVCGDNATGSQSVKIETLEVDFTQPVGPQRERSEKRTWSGLWAFSATEDAVFLEDIRSAAYTIKKVVLGRPGNPDNGQEKWSTNVHTRSVTYNLLATSSGGVIGSTGVREPGDFNVFSIDVDGKILWETTFPKSDYYDPAIGLDINDGLAYYFYKEATPGSLEERMRWVLFTDSNGNETARTPFPDIDLQLEIQPWEKDANPGVGTAFITTFAPTADGGILAAGYYQFGRLLQCGTREAPEQPRTSTCADVSYLPMLARFAPDHSLSWSRTIGKPWTEGYSFFKAVAELKDGSIMAAGYRYPARWSESVMLGLVTHWDAAGNIVWAKGIPWGKYPGSGRADFVAMAPQADGTVDLVFTPPPGLPYRFLGMKSDGKISRMQSFDKLTQDCTHWDPEQVVGSSIGYAMSIPNGVLIAKYYP
jgi:hypothetical protein